MRILLIALCTVAAYSLQTCAAFSQIQERSELNEFEPSSKVAAFPIHLEVCLEEETATITATTEKETAATTKLPSMSIRLIGAQTLASENPAEGLLSNLIEDTHCRVISDNALIEIQPLASESISQNSDISNTTSFEGATATVSSPLERSPIRLLHLETANQLISQALQLSFGSHQTLSDDTPGTGSQLYYTGVDWGVTDDVQLSFSAQIYDDPPARAINGELQNITLVALSSSVRYRLLNAEQLALSLQGALEVLSLSSDLFNTGEGEGVNLVGSVHAPLTYTVSPDFQLHLTPGISFLPDQLNGNEFYDTLFSLGTGLNWQPSERWLLYSAINLPLGPGGNTLEADQTIGDQLVWSVGTRYSVTPRTGVNLYATNGLGITPATAILTAIPGGDEVLVGVELQYTPDTGLGYRARFDDASRPPLSDRDRQLLGEGITLANANTLAPGNVALTAGVGTEGNFDLGLAYSPDEALQLEASVEEFGSIDEMTATSDALQYVLGARVQLLDQRLGDMVSLSARVLGGRDTAEEGTTGVLFADLPLTYEVSSQLALLFDPRVAFSGEDTRVGLGFGVNYEIVQGLQLIGEVTPVFDGDRTVWAVGTRYSFPNNALSLDTYATNAVGRHGIGTLVGEADTRFGAGINWVVGQ